jgi:mRNA interferase MazF
MHKDYWRWHELKSSLQEKSEFLHFHEREVWYCSIGVNLGYEQDGKNNLFERPIIILKKLNSWTFFGIPMTTKQKQGSFYAPFVHENQTHTAIIGQLRIFDARRLNRKCFTLEPHEFEKVRTAMKSFL